MTTFNQNQNQVENASNTNTATPRRVKEKVDIYENLGGKILEFTNSFESEEQKKVSNKNLPRNFVTNSFYSGYNMLSLLTAGFDSPYFLTAFLQIVLT